MSTMGYVSTLKGAGASGSLNLDFTTQEYTVQGFKRTFSDIVTFQRSSAGGVFTRAGKFEMRPAHEPRFDHDPDTGVLRGLLVEEARTNTLSRSAELDHRDWGCRSGSVTPDVIMSPDGTKSADKFVESTDSGVHTVHRGHTPVQGETYTFSVFVKAAERTFCEVWWGGFGNQVAANNVVLDMVSGSFTQSDADRTVVQKLKDGWWRVSTTTTSANGGVIQASVNSRAGTTEGGASNYQGDGVSGLYVWGGQIEKGAFPTSYIPTTTVEVTRSVDRVTVNNLSPWWNPVEGVIFADHSPNIYPVTSTVVSMSSTSATLSMVRISVTAANHSEGRVNKEDGTTMMNTSISLATPRKVKAAIGLKLDDIIFSAESNLSQRIRAGEMPTPTSFSIGALQSANSAINGHVHSVVYFPSRLSNELLQVLTSN